MKRRRENEEMEAMTKEMTVEEEDKDEDREDKAGSGDGGGGGGDGGFSLAAVEEVGVRHASALLGVAGEVPLDVARTILAAHHRTLRATHASGRQRLTGGFIQCPTCSTPWIAGLCKPRLLGCPRNPKAQRSRLRRIIRRAQTHPGKLTSQEKSLLSRYQNRENVIEVSCLVCRHKKHEFFPVPERQKEEEREEEVEKSSSKNMKKKKKKRKVKEVNAGLLLSSTSSSSTVRKKKGKNERREASPTSSIFTTATEVKKDILDTHRDARGNPRATLGTHKNTLTHPRLKPRAKVLLGNETPGATLPHPASAPTPGVARERKRTVSNLKRIMSKEKAKSDMCNGKSRNSLSNFLDSLF